MNIFASIPLVVHVFLYLYSLLNSLLMLSHSFEGLDIADLTSGIALHILNSIQTTNQCIIQVQEDAAEASESVLFICYSMALNFFTLFALTHLLSSQ